MVDFTSLWDKHSAVLNDRAGQILGDRFRYRRGDVWLGDATLPPEQRTIPGYVVIGDRLGSQDDYAETIDRQTRVKISAALIGEPQRSDRLAHPKLGPGWWQPIGALRDQQGDDWIFDVQAAPL